MEAPSETAAGPDSFDADRAKHFAHDNKVIQGKDGWLFLANDTNKVLAQHTGSLRLSKKELKRWRKTLENRAAWLDERDIRSVVLIAPNTHSIYPELLPEELPLSPSRPVFQLLLHLAGTGSGVHLLYPQHELRAARSTRPVCFSTDAHWNDWGAYVTYRLVMDRLATLGVSCDVVEEEQVSFVEEEREGDLGIKLGIPKRKQYVARMPVRSRIVYDNRVINRGHHLVMENDQAGPLTCMVFGDSFAWRLLWFLAESFGRLVYANASMDRTLVEREDPDVVIQLWAERFLIAVPDDSKEPSVGDWEARKRSQGLVRPA